MKFCRFQPLEFSAASLGNTGKEIRPEPRCGMVANGQVREISGDVLGTWNETGRAWALSTVKLLPPVVPGKIVCVGRNYAEHAGELGNAAPKEPLIFFKPPSAVIGPEELIVLPRISHQVDYEGEVAVIISRPCSPPGPSGDTRPYIAGYTCLNDVTARDLQQTDVQYTRPKGFDTFCPLGPVMETEFDPADAILETWVNGVRKQSSRTSEMIFSVDAIIKWISQVMTLWPGDVIALGTPSGVGPLNAGDMVEVIASGIGTLRNTVIGPES